MKEVNDKSKKQIPLRVSAKLYEALPFEYFSRDMAKSRPNGHRDPERAKKLIQIREITKEGRALIKAHYNSDIRIRTVCVRLLEHHADFCDLISDWLLAKANGETERATELYDKARIEFGKREAEIQLFFDHTMYFGDYEWANKVKPSLDNGIYLQ